METKEKTAEDKKEVAESPKGDLGSTYFVDGNNHGFHIHAGGDTRPDCTAAGGHFKSADNQIHGTQEQAVPDR